MNGDFLLERIAATKATIVAYEEAVLALGESGGVSSYTLDTGQTRQTVTRSEVTSLNNTLTRLYNRLATLEARAGIGAGVLVVRPAW